MAKKTTAKSQSAAKNGSKSATKTKKPAVKSGLKTAAIKSDGRGPKVRKSAGPVTATTSARTMVQSVRGEPGSRISPAKNTVSDELDRPLTPDDLRKIKSGLSKKDIEHYHELLMQKRAELLGDVASLQTDSRNNSGGNLSNMPLHMADVGSDNYEQEFTLGLVESERRLLQEIDEAILRIKDGTYGVCVEMGVPIGKPRLDAKPWAKHCIEAARKLEKRGR